jgi:hypothetical protein
MRKFSCEISCGVIRGSISETSTEEKRDIYKMSDVISVQESNSLERNNRHLSSGIAKDFDDKPYSN